MVLQGALGLLVLALSSQETRTESALQSAVRATLEKGFSYSIRPVASLPNFSMAREELAGAAVKGSYADGVFHASDGLYEIYKKGDKVAVRTESGWLPLEQFLAPLRQDAKEAFDGDGERWSRGNVTQGRKAVEKIIRLSHLAHRSDIRRLTALSSAFSDLRDAGKANLDGGPATPYEGDLTDLAAFHVLQGPFEELVKRGTLSFQSLSGVGRVYVKDGIVRRIHVRAGGKYGFYNDEDNVRRKGFCTLEILVDITGVGEAKVVPPKEAAALIGP